MRVSFNSLLSRADEDALSHLLGKGATRLIEALDPALARPSRLRGVVAELKAPEVLLRDSASRTQLLALLKPDEAGELCVRLGLPAGDPFVPLLRLRPRKGSQAEAIIFDFFGVAPHELPTPEPLPDSLSLSPTYGLFEHQRSAVRDAREKLATAPYRALLHMPTGSGKTRTALNLICEELRRAEPTLVVWLAYSEELCEQTASEFEQAWRHLGDRGLSVLRYWGKHRLSLGDARDGLLVAGLGKMYETIRSDYQKWARIADRTSLVVIDEAHQALAETYRTTLELLVERDGRTALLGLTATPGRTWSDIEEDERLAKLFARRKVGLSIGGFDSPVEYLVAEGYLAEVEFRSLMYGGGTEISDRDLESLSTSIDVPDGILRRLAEDEQRNLIIIREVEAMLATHSRIVVFATTVQHAELIAAVLQARGIDAFAVTGGTPPYERERRIRRFKSESEEPRVLCNFGVLTTGFDAPKTSAAIIARPTKSLVLYSQMVGRAMRGPRAGGNKKAEVATVIDSSLPGFGDITEAFHNWEDVWK